MTASMIPWEEGDEDRAQPSTDTAITLTTLDGEELELTLSEEGHPNHWL